jgi:amidohydrolase
MMRYTVLTLAISILSSAPNSAQTISLAHKVAAVQPKVIAWRRDIHQNPELSNREIRTAALVAALLKKLGMDVRTGVAGTGVIGVLKGGKPGGVIALRADMDALPVEEKTGLLFASKATGSYNGKTVPVAHACGHDAHTAMLMGAADVLAAMRKDIPGTVVFLFQPAEEGAPDGEQGGAAQMVSEGAMKNPVPQAVFGMHVMPGPLGEVRFRSKGFLAASDRIRINLTGKQTHGSQPWAGVDITSLGADVIQAINQIAARQIDIQVAPHVITIATVTAGVRHNIIPETMQMTGTLRTFDEANRQKIITRMREMIGQIAAGYGAKAEVLFDAGGPLTYNDPALAASLLPAIQRAAGPDKVDPATNAIMGSEDFGDFLSSTTPGLFVALGATKANTDWKSAPSNHSPYFDIDESAMETGVRLHAEIALAFLGQASRRK